MLTYTYTARDLKTGHKVEAEVQAENEKAAAQLLAERGLTPLDIEVKGEGGSFLSHFRNRVKTKQKVIFSRQLSTLINAGLPLVQSLNTVKGQTNNRVLRAITGEIIRDVEGGSTLSDAMARHPRVFNNVYTSLVAAGEASGTLDTSLERLSTQQEKDAEIVAKVRGALIYPLIVLLVLVAVVTFMLTTVLPQVQTLYEGLPGAELPIVTRVLLAVSNVLVRYWWVILIILAIVAFLGTRWAQTPPGRRVVDELKMRIWPVGSLFKKLYMARFARTGATLVGSGVPMIKMLSTTADAVGNIHVAESIRKATEQVKGGKTLSESLSGDPYFLDLVPDMIKIGEQSGQLESMMGKVADYYEKEVDNQVKAISTTIEPGLMIIVGILALIIVAAILLPIYSLAGNNLLQQLR
ncbi:pilus assembly protein PilC [Candidatus Saccharibacteria bacterium RIFCSPHIGHO2_12_FULL_49_19]|nr:MAG: pilus assembly protein PilC [Candidatus Saccharibacteria bacterium RIFCSPHIGHO2_12_FULL_49_19]